MLIKCHECGAEISDQAPACIKCGAPPRLNAPEPRSGIWDGPPNSPPPTAERGAFRWWWIPVGGLAAFLGLAIIGSHAPGADARVQEREVIKLCWDDHDRKSLDPATKRFVASTCEKLEADFRAKHSVSP